MRIYSDYIDRHFTFPDLNKERKQQLKRISEIRDNRAIFTYASDLTKSPENIGIDYDDLLPISDQLSNLKGDKIDIILETPGGKAEVAEDIVNLIRNQFSEVAMIVPGYAKSAGTIMVMAGDEILMESASALGPIDAQIRQGNKQFSAQAFIDGLNKIKDEVEEVGRLNRAFIPILQNISPGEIETCNNLLEFSKKLVKNWLVDYKFKFWKNHSRTGRKVTQKQKEKRAEEIAKVICDHKKWLTHARSIKLGDLRKMGLKITDYSENPDLFDAIKRYHILLMMTFNTTNIFKLFETPESQIYRHITLLSQSIPTPKKGPIENAFIDVECNKCKNITKLQANFKKGIFIQPGYLPFPKDNKLICPKCNNNIDISTLRRQLELQAKSKIL